MSQQKSNYLENQVIDSFLRGVAPTLPTTLAVSLHTGDPGEDGLLNEVAGGLGYSRQTVSFDAASGGITQNSGLVSFGPASGAWGTVTHFGIWESAPGANFLYYGSLSSSKSVTAPDILEFLAGNIIVQET